MLALKYFKVKRLYITPHIQNSILYFGSCGNVGNIASLRCQMGRGARDPL